MEALQPALLPSMTQQHIGLQMASDTLSFPAQIWAQAQHELHKTERKHIRMPDGRIFMRKKKGGLESQSQGLAS